MIQKSKNYDKATVEPQTRGRGKEILVNVGGADPKALDGKHCGCILPGCPGNGGKDRFRAIDPDNGVLYCNQCFYEKNGDIFAAVQRLLGCSFSEAVNKIGEYLNCSTSQPVKRKQPAPKKPATPLNEQVRFLDPDPEKFAEWAGHKPPVTVDAMQAAGVRLAIWPAKAPTQYQQECIAFPAYRNSDDPSGWILYRVDGQPFPAMKDGPGERKTHLLRGSDDGWVMFGGRSAVEEAHTIIKCEGLPDFLSIYSRLPAGYAVVTNTHGAKSAKNNPIDIFTGKRVIVIGDNDESGVDGAHSLAREILPYASEVKMIFPDGEVTESNGKDIRDVMNENQQAGIDHQKTVAALIRKAEQSEPFQVPQDEPQQDDSETDDSSDDDDQPEEYQPFPVHCFPAVMRDYVEAGSKSLQCDFSYIALPLLVVAASMIGASRVLRVSRDWKVPAILWGVVIADSGCMKSPAMSLATAPLYKLQARAHAKNSEAIEAYELRNEIYETRRKEYVKELAKADGPPPDEPEKPDEPRIIDKVAGDVTFERLAYMVKHNPKGIPLVKDEISGLIGNLNKYSGSKGSDEAVLLEGYNLGTMQVHRKHDPRDIFVPNAAISILGNTQPKIYRRMMSGSYRESGFMARFLKVYPPRTMKAFPGEGISDDLKEALMTLIESLDQLQPMEMEDGIFQPLPIDMTREALQAYKEFHQCHNSESVSMSGDLAAESSKLEEIPVRIALTFHCIECVTSGRMDEKVSAETMNNAIQLTEWFKNESLRVYRLFDSEGDSEETPQQKQKRRLIRLIRRKGGRVKPRDIQQGIKDITTAPQAELELNELVKNGVGEWVNIETGNPGRPSLEFQLFTRSTGQQSTNHAKNNGENMGFVEQPTESDDSQPIPAPEPIGEQYEMTAPDDLGDFMDFMDDK
jgi:5S rRNA maturation endonuclease (ribonuclease M5)